MLAVIGLVNAWREASVAAPVLLVIGVAFPRVTRAVVAALDAVARVMGVGVKAVALTVFFLLVITPIGWLRRTAGFGEEAFEPGRAARPAWVVREHAFDASDLDGPG
jgi:hypothetical protein